MKCPKCDQQLLSDATVCHKCGKEIIIQLEKHNFRLVYFIAPIVIVLAITAFLLGSYSHRSETSTLGSAFDNSNELDESYDSPNDEYDDSDLESFISGNEPETTTVEQTTADTAETYEAQSVIEDTNTSVAATESTIETDTNIPMNTFADPQLFADQVLSFRTDYKLALNEGNYSYVQQYILPQSQAEQELSDFVGDMSGKNYYYNFIRTEILGVQLIDGGALVDTFEIFDFIDDQGKETHYERFKTYVMEIGNAGNGEILISAIEITDTDKQ